jgi:hypothetical protein
LVISFIVVLKIFIDICTFIAVLKSKPEERIPKLILKRVPEERRKRGRSRKTWMEGVQAAITARNLEQDQWINGEEWRLVCGRGRQLL